MCVYEHCFDSISMNESEVKINSYPSSEEGLGSRL